MAEAEIAVRVNTPEQELTVGSTTRTKLKEIACSQLEHALDARRRGLKIYESLKSLNDVIGTQYGDRVLFELVQNAHDAHDKDDEGEIAVQLIVESDSRGELLVANRGRPFTASNLDAIRNIGTSDKEIGEGIGNKGLGFRSVEALTDDVRIYSSSGAVPAEAFDGYCFRFATAKEMEEILAELGAPTGIREEVAANLPRYLVPVPALDQSESVRHLAKAAGFATVVTLPLNSAAAVDLARRQVRSLASPDAPVLLFLERIAAVDIKIFESDAVTLHRPLKKKAEAVASASRLEGMRMERVTLDDGDSFFVVKLTLPRQAVLEAVRSSLSAAPPLKRWLAWKGDAVVSLAVPLSGPSTSAPRLFNFLPMDEKEVAPIAGYLDAPFFADIDRRSMKSDLPLNKYLLEAAAVAAAAGALAIVDEDLPVPARVIVDLIAWSPPHIQKIVAGFTKVGVPLAKAPIWPVVSGGSTKWAGMDRVYAWPDVRTQYLTPSRLAASIQALIISPALGDIRLSRVRALAAAVSQSLSPTSEVLGSWTLAVAEQIASSRRANTSRWRSFYDDVVALFGAGSIPLHALQGRAFLIGADGKLLIATAGGVAGAPPVFFRVQGSRGRRGDAPPSPPGSLAKKFRFLNENVNLSDTALRAFEKAGLLRRYDPVEVLKGLRSAMGGAPTDAQRRDALLWAFRVWRSGGGKTVEDAVRAANLHVPTLVRWSPASEASLSGTWSNGAERSRYICTKAPRNQSTVLANATGSSSDIRTGRGLLQTIPRRPGFAFCIC